MGKKFDINAYVKNATRSVAHVTAESLKNANPVISEFAETNSDVIKELYQGIRDFKKHAGAARESAADNEYVKIAKETASNFFDDLKTGKFYNVDREKQSDSAMFAAFGLDEDSFGGDWDDDSAWGDDSSDDTLTKSSMDIIGEKISKAQGKSSMKSADYIVKSMRSNSKAERAHTNYITGKLMSGMGAINTTLAAIGKEIVPKFEAHARNADEYHKFMIDHMAKQTGYIENIYKILDERFGETAKKNQRISGSRKNPWQDIFGGGGSLDLAEYFKYAKENIKDQLSMFSMMGSMMSSFDGEAGKGSSLRTMLSSPVSLLMGMGLDSILGSGRIGKSFGKLNSAIAGGLASIPGYIRRKAKGGGTVWGFIEEILGLNASKKRSLDTSKYEKGRVDWTGKDSKALQEVIPTLLAKIHAALTGQEPKIFDYEKGKWVSYSSVVKDFSSQLKGITRNSQRDIIDEMSQHFVNDAEAGNSAMGFVKTHKNVRSSKMYRTWQDDLLNLLNYLQRIGWIIPKHESEWRQLHLKMKQGGLFATATKNGIMLESNFRRVKEYYTRMINSGNGLGRLAMANASLENSNFAHNALMDKLEKDDVFRQLYNNSGLGTAALPKPSQNNIITNAIDDKGNNLFYYLQNMHVSLMHIRDNIANAGGWQGRNKRRKDLRGKNVESNYEIEINQANLKSARDRENKSRPGGSTTRYDSADEDGDPEEEKIRKSRAEEFSESLKSKAKGSKAAQTIDRVSRAVGKLFGKPIDGFESVVDKVDRKIFEFFYGKIGDKEDQEHNSFIAKFYEGFEDFFKTLREKTKKLFDEKINPLLTAAGDKIAGLFGFRSFKDMWSGAKAFVKDSDIYRRTKEELKGAGRFVKNSVKSTFGEVKDFFTGGKKSKAARGGYVTKSGMVSVSEGEIILPNNSPFANRYEMDRVEESNARNYLKSGGKRYWGNFAGGGTPKMHLKDSIRLIVKAYGEKAADDFKKFTKQQKKEFNRRVQQGEPYATAFANVYNQATKAKDAFVYAVEDMASEEDIVGASKRKIKYAAKKFARKARPVADEAIGSFSDILHRLFGDLSDKDGSKKIGESVKDWLKDAGKHAPSLLAGGLIGGGVSTVAGLAGGPLLGVAVGSAIGYARKSEKLQKALFGEKDDNEEFKGNGLLGPTLTKALTKMLPDLSKFGVTGGLAGLLGLVPGGPIAGLLLGSGLGMLVKSDDMREYLFGDEGILGKDSDQKIKKMLPKMALGAGAMALTGPFGLVGNLFLGSAIGMVTSTDKFREFIFGTKDSNGELQGGLLGSIRKRIVDPMKEYFKIEKDVNFFEGLMQNVMKPINRLVKPLGDWIKGSVASISDSIRGKLNEVVVQPLANAVDRWVIKPMAGFFGKIGKGALWVGRKLLGAVGITADMYGKGRERKNIRKGYATSLSRQERAAMQADPNLGTNYKFAAYDMNSAKMSSEDLKSSYEALKDYKKFIDNETRTRKVNNQEIMNQLIADAGMDSTFFQNRRLAKYLSKGNWSDAESWINEQNLLGNIDAEKADKAIKSLVAARDRYNQSLLDTEEKKKNSEDARKAMAALGIDESMLFGKDANKLFRLMASDIKKDEHGLALAQKDLEARAAEASERKYTIVNKIHNGVYQAGNTLYQIRNAIYSMAKMAIPDDAGNPKNNRNNAIVGDKADSFDNEGYNAKLIDFALYGRDAAEKYKSEEPNDESDNKKSVKDIVSNIVSGNDKENDADDLADLTGGASGVNPNSKWDGFFKRLEKVIKRSKDGDDSVGATRIVDTEYGPAEYVKTSSGWAANMRDAATKTALDLKGKANSMKDKFFSGMHNIFGFFQNLTGKKKDDKEDKEKKEGFFDKIKDFFGGGLFGGGLGGGLLKGGLLAGGLMLLLNLLGGGEGLENIIDKFKEGLSSGKEGIDNLEDALRGKDLSKYGEDEFKSKNLTDRYMDTLIKKSLILGQEGNKPLSKVPIVGKLLNTPLKVVGKARNLVVKGGKAIANSKLGQKVANSKLGKGVSSLVGKAGTGIKNIASSVGKKAGSAIAGTKLGGAAVKAGKSVVNTFSSIGTNRAASKALKSFGGNKLDKATKKAFKESFASFASEGVEKAGLMAAENIGLDVAKKGATNSGVISKIVSVIKGAFTKLFGAIGIKGGAEVAEQASKEIAEKALKKGGSKLAQNVAKMSPLALVFIANAFTEGLQSAGAKRILGILTEPTLTERAIAATVHAINEAIPGIGGFIDTGDILDVIFRALDMFGVNPFDDLMAKRQAAQEEIAAYNLANDETYDIEEYLKNVQGEYTIQDRVSSFVGKTGSAVAKGAKAVGGVAWKGVKAAATGLAKGGAALVGGAKALGTGIVKTGSAAVKGVKAVGSSIAKVGGSAIGGIKSIGKGIGSVVGGLLGTKDNEELTKTENTIVESTKTIGNIISMSALGPVGMIGSATKAIADNFIKDEDSAKNVDMSAMMKDLWGFVTGSKNISDFDSTLSKYLNTGTGMNAESTKNIIQSVGGIIKMIAGITNPIMGLANGAKSIISKLFGTDEVKKVNPPDNARGTTSTGGIMNGIKNIFNKSGDGSGVHVSQYDSRFSGRRFGHHTVGEKGCGPAVAATVLRSYGRNASFNDTIDYAEANGYVAGASGTRAGYFGDVFARNGIGSKYSDSKSEIRNNIKSGRPTVLLGQDSGNRSKMNSPFGPNPHYVVAQGMDRRGNVVVDDPELGSTAIYKSNILNKAKMGVLTGGDSGVTSNGDYIGKYVRKYESGSKGSAMISSGAGDYGGVSFGTYQFPSYKQSVTTKGTLPEFWNRYYAASFPGIQPGNNDAFKAAWLKAVESDPTKFFENEHAYIAGQYYTPIASKLASNGVGDPTTYDRAAQEAAWSTAVQYGPGGAAKLFAQAGVNTTMDPKTFIDRLYTYKHDSVPTKFKNSSGAVQKSIQNRFKEEKQLLLGLAGQKPIDPNTVNGAVSSGGVGTTTSTTSTNTESQSSGSSFGDVGSMIGGIFNKILGKAFGMLGSTGSFLSKIFGIGDSGSSSSGTGSVDTSSYTDSVAYNGTAPTAGTDVESKVVSLMKQIEGKNEYTMSGKRERVLDTLNGASKGYGDCSATVRKVIQAATGKNIGGNTEDQYVNYQSRGGIIVNNRTIDESKLRPGDALYYARPTSGYTQGRKDRVGHVEMYIGNGKRMGHGSGMGPRESSVHDDENRFLKAIRFTAGNSGLDTNGLRVLDFSKITGAGSRPEGFTSQQYGMMAKQTVNKFNRAVGGSSGATQEQIAALLEFVKAIAQNTANNIKLVQIVELMSQIIQLMGSRPQQPTIITSGSQSSDNVNDDALNSQISEMVNKLTQLAKAV